MKDRIRSTFHEFIGDGISWVGECPWTNDLGFGTESGRFLSSLSDEGFGVLEQVADDAVNGVAFAGKTVASSSRESILVAQQKRGTRFEAEQLLKLPFGAHGAVSTAQGVFLFPTGPEGILIVGRDNVGERFSSSFIQHAETPFNSYQLLCVGISNQHNVIACAARAHGVLILLQGGSLNSPTASTHGFPGKDIVGISPVRDPGFPFAVVALSLSGDVFLIANVLEKARPRGVSFPEVQGTPYAICASHDSIFLLTNKELAVIPGAITQLLSSESGKHEQVASIIPARASDLFLVGKDSIFLLSEGIADEFRVDDLISGRSGKRHHQPSRSRLNRPESRAISEVFVEPEWTSSQSKIVLASVA